jgi:hypothetical protein
MVSLGFGGRAQAVSGDGTVIVGFSSLGNSGFRWTQATGMASLGTTFGTAWGVSADGTVAVGELIGEIAYRWTEATGAVAINGRAAFGASADGAVVVGVDNSSIAFRWTQATGPVSLGTLPGGDASYASDVTPDGTVLVGASTSPIPLGVQRSQAYRWTQETGMISLGDLPGGDFFSRALAVSADGAVIVGGFHSNGWVRQLADRLREYPQAPVVRRPSVPPEGRVPDARHEPHVRRWDTAHLLLDDARLDDGILSAVRDQDGLADLRHEVVVIE